MTTDVKGILAGGMVIIAVAVTVPTSLFMNQRKINDSLQEQKRVEQEAFMLQIQEHEQRAETLIKQIEELNSNVETLGQLNKQLEAENQALEGVQQSIIDSVGYYPNEYERNLLERLVECEAGAESMEGKIAVVNVVLNRVKSEKFPDSISGVIYQENQFEPVVSGVIDAKAPSEESKEAVKRAFLGERVVGSDINYFWASWLTRSNDLWNHLTPVMTIGVHHFAKGWN